MLLISDADDDKIEWVIEAVKAFLPQSANNQYLDYSFDYEGRYDEYGHRKMERLELTNILKLPNSRFTPSGFNHFCCKLYQRKMLYTKILFQSPFIESNAEEIFVSGMWYSFCGCVRIHGSCPFIYALRPQISLK